MTGAKSIMRGVSLVDAQPFHREDMPRQAGSCPSCQTLGVRQSVHQVCGEHNDID